VIVNNKGVIIVKHYLSYRQPLCGSNIVKKLRNEMDPTFDAIELDHFVLLGLLGLSSEFTGLT
jgi:hypothetical protein